MAILIVAVFSSRLSRYTCDGFLAGGRDYGSEPAIGEGFFDDDLDILIVLDDQDIR